MTDDEIVQVADRIDWMRNAVTDRPLLTFARSIIAQARAELIAEMETVAWADQYALKLLRCGYHAAVSPQHTNNATCALAIIPDTKE